jgi:hypothetical protein
MGAQGRQKIQGGEVMKKSNSIISWLWKIPVCAIAYFWGTVIGGGMTTALALEMPRFPGELDPTLQGWLLIPAGLVYALGLAAMAIGLAGRWWERWVILALFLFCINGVGNAIETTIFTTLGGPVGAAAGFLLPSVLCALAVALLFPAPSETSLAAKTTEFFSHWKPGRLALRLLLAVLAFPVVYFFFGMIVAPIVTPYYAELEFLKIPPITTLIPVLHLRSALIFLVTLPIIIGWDGSRSKFILGLALGNAAAVGLGGLVQVTFFPAVLQWTHGIEILADGIVYAWILALLFVPKDSRIELSQPSANDQLAA